MNDCFFLLSVLSLSYLGNGGEIKETISLKVKEGSGNKNRKERQMQKETFGSLDDLFSRCAVKNRLLMRTVINICCKASSEIERVTHKFEWGWSIQPYGFVIIVVIVLCITNTNFSEKKY